MESVENLALYLLVFDLHWIQTVLLMEQAKCPM